MKLHLLLALNMTTLSNTDVRALFICEVTKITESCLHGSKGRSFSSLFVSLGALSIKYAKVLNKHGEAIFWTERSQKQALHLLIDMTLIKIDTGLEY